MNEPKIEPSLSPKIRELEQSWGTQFVEETNLGGLDALINGRAIHWWEEGLIEIRRLARIPDRFVLTEKPSLELLRIYLAIGNDQVEGEKRKSVAFCYHPKTGLGRLS